MGRMSAQRKASGRPDGKKKQILAGLFEMCRARGDMVFTSEELREIAARHNFSNPHDAVKLDNLSKLPKVMLESDHCLIHLGKGRHQFVRGVMAGFHRFERIPAACEVERPYNPSLLNEANTSESNILSVGVNQRIFHEFLYGDKEVEPKVYCAHRTKRSVSYTMAGARIRTDALQMECDLTFELGGRVTIFEGKNEPARGLTSDFAVYQLFHPYLYYSALKEEKKYPIDKIDGCYFLRRKDGEDSVARVYLYEFREKNPASIRLVKCAEYRLVRE